MAYFTNKYTSFLSTNTHLVFPRQPSCLFRELIYTCKHEFKCMVKLDIVSVEILTNIMFSSKHMYSEKYICILSYVLFQKAVHEVYVLKDCKNSHENI